MKWPEPDRAPEVRNEFLFRTTLPEIHKRNRFSRRPNSKNNILLKTQQRVRSKEVKAANKDSVSATLEAGLDNVMDSDSDSDLGERENWQWLGHQNLTSSRSKHEELNIKYRAAHRMKICYFWLPILLQRDERHEAFRWALHINLIEKKEDLTIKHLQKIETLEAICRALERGILDPEQAKGVLWISNMFSLGFPMLFADAVHWLTIFGEPDMADRIKIFGSEQTCFMVLDFVFMQYGSFIKTMSSNVSAMLDSLKTIPSSYNMEKSEKMKEKGNEYFRKEQYEEAVKFYTQAINNCPDNHLIYGNRALCYIKSKKYLKAVCDGKRAILIEPFWPKGHYRYCEALFSLGEVQMAICANSLAINLCQSSEDGIKDLEKQYLKFHCQSGGFKVEQPMKSQKKRLNREHTPESGSGNDNTSKKVTPATSTDAPAAMKEAPAATAAPQKKVSQNKMGKKTRKNEREVLEGSSSKACEPTANGMTSKTQRVETGSLAGASNATKKMPKAKSSENEKQKKGDDKVKLCVELSRMVQDAHAALTDLRSYDAEQAFHKALVLLGTTTPKDLGLSTHDVLLLLYGHASALTAIGKQEKLAEAQGILKKMESYEERMFQCLVFYGIGRVFVRENRFAVALQPFLDSLHMVQNHIMPGKLTWPFTKEVVMETQPDYLKGLLEDAISSCKFPPNPDAICRSEKCLGKPEIYLTDPDFKGFIRIRCCQKCVVEYHMTCWKSYKTLSSCEKNEKEFLQGPCLTPDCIGQICSVEIFDHIGKVKCKFKETILKAEKQKKPKLTQKCSSLKKLKSKEERLIRRKQHKQARQESQVTNSEVLQQEEDSACQAPEKAWLQYRDRVLLQISQKMELFREEKSLCVATFASALKPWLKLDLSRKNQLALKLLHWEKEQLETLGQFAEVLLERKNRVWARVFIQVLGTCAGINPKLCNWACALNETGLNAAKSFLERFSRELEQLDLTVLLRFEPFEDMIKEKLDAKPELFLSIGLSVAEYLKQAPPHDTRLFIWALEEHRDHYVHFQSILDEYFDVMDGRYSIIQKTNEIKNNSPIKNRVRKKKQKEPKIVFPVQGAMYHGRGGVTSQEDHEFLEDEPLSFLHSSDPFHVPSHLQEQVADFELQYNSTRHRGRNDVLENIRDSTEEALYNYFAQILEASGPLDPENPLLVGELDNFPPDAQNSIRDAGGLQTFLLQSRHFIRVGSCIALAKNAATLQQAEGGAGLDQLDDFEYHDMNAVSPYTHASAFTSYSPGYFSATNGSEWIPNTSHNYMYPPAPPPDVTHSFTQPAVTESGLSSEVANIDTQQLSPSLVSVDEEVDLYSSEDNIVVEENGPSTSSVADEETVLFGPTAVQVPQETRRSVAVNTELHERFEKQLGDINKMQKSIGSMEEQIEKISSGCEKVDVEDLTDLKDEIQKITANIQVTNTELSLFQQKLEEEVKKDQKEKKANQEVLKSLKVKREQLMEEQKSLAHKLRETKANYDTVLSDFLGSSNRIAAEKSSLEGKIQSCKTQLSLATRRSHIAQTLYQENIDQEKSRRRITEQPFFGTNNLPEAPAPSGTRGNPVPSSSHSPPLYVQPSAAEAGATAALVQHKRPDRNVEHAGSTVFDKVMEQLTAMFPHHTRSHLMKFIHEFRSSNGGTLTSVPSQEMVGGVAQLILESQERQNSTTLTSVGSVAQSTTPPPPVWQKPELQEAVPKKALNTEDPCIICHEDMVPHETCVLDCRHSFHSQCIKPWLKGHNTCPTCRVHILLQEDFPALSTKRRKAP
ncbi:E3 ubiquitin-protein ligase TTC3 isoform X1 [Takifugu rubripes]|uniref:E3 ubiquitin-protein ligase TTC3 isoform X1 n=3 Tax=Takifugu rubripes TaxID=31033 RepID=UPI0011459EFB|nr:E3 ubiquitin-protein ligase TTC3 isoform X1 [Takifugu rubripes]